MTKQSLNIVAGVFGWRFLLCAGVQVLVLAVFLLIHDFALGLHQRFFDITPQQFDLTTYHFLMLMKVIGIAFFLIPWAALKITSRKLP